VHWSDEARFLFKIRCHAIVAGVVFALSILAGGKYVRDTFGGNVKTYGYEREAAMIRNILFICLILIVLITVFQNTQVVEFRFIVWTISLSRALMLFGTLAAGFMAGWLLRVPKQRKEQKGQNKIKK
jgi:uncharacterized integral membrane protein